MSDILPEVACAAHWWAECLLERSPVDTGDKTADAFWEWGRRYGVIPSPESIEKFEKLAAEKIQEVINRATWDPGNPLRGGYARLIYCDYHPCDALAEAAKLAGIGELNFPAKVTMWIDPGSVRVNLGYYIQNPTEIFAKADER